MIPLNYHQLYYFWTIAKLGSFRAASQPLFLAVSTLSAQLAQLEKSMGMRLLERSRRGVSLTPEGRTVYERCERIFTEGDSLAALVKKGPSAIPPPFRLGVPPSISAWIVLKALDFITSTAPNVRVSVLGGSQGELQELLRAHSLDAAITNFDYTSTLGHDFASRLIAKIPISFVGTPKVKRSVPRFPRDLANVPLLSRTTDNPIRRTLDAYLREHGIRPRMEIEIENTQLIRLLALQGRGAAVIDTLTINEDLKAKRLVKLHSTPTRMEEYVWLLFNARPKPNPELAKAIQGLAKEFAIEL